MSLWVFELGLATDESCEEKTIPSKCKGGTTAKKLLATALRKRSKNTTKDLKVFN